MPRWFNTAGPCRADIHYMLPATSRLPNLQRVIAQQNYFVIYAPRQGKTTAMVALTQQLIDSGQYTAVLVSAEVGAPLSQDIAGAEDAILGAWRTRISSCLPPPTSTTRVGNDGGRTENAIGFTNLGSSISSSFSYFD
jgi:hypothetical protein